jgi:hypothetical protein
VGFPFPPTDHRDHRTDLLVVASILLETIGIIVDDDRLIAIIDKSEYKETLEQLTQEIAGRHWQDVVRTLQKGFKLLFASSLWVAFRGRFAAGLAARCVPIVGWLYLAAAFIVAVKANYHRFSVSAQPWFKSDFAV